MEENLSINQAIVKVAKGYIGIKEISGNKGWKNKDFEKKMKKMGWTSGQAWCMYFVKLVIHEAYLLIGNDKMAQWALTLNGGVLSSFSKMKSKTVVHPPTNPQPGFIGIMQHGTSQLGHTFIVDRLGDVDKMEIKTIEGNTNSGGVREGDGVYERTRYTDNMMKNKLQLVNYVELR